jgi:hypothetical protein
VDLVKLHPAALFLAIWNSFYMALIFIPLALGFEQYEFREPNQWIAVIECVFGFGFAGYLVNKLRKEWRNAKGNAQKTQSRG